MTTPDVSVILITYNDAERLPRALASIQRQTLRNLEIIVVDDASTDDTERVVRDIAITDPRVRYERLAVNSGGCSAPRNRGVELARALWVMFCDSDDEYEPHACKNLLLTAERLDAEVVCGAAERVDVRSGKARRWRPELHDDERAADSLESFPELLADTISVNKIYSRALLERESIAFPEGLLFEDQLFTLEAMSAARGVAVIPQVVYRWYVDSLGEELSITQRRMEARNVDDRVEINRRIDAFLAERGREDLRRVKDIKFLRHDLYVYLSAILEADDATAGMLIQHLQAYVSSIDARLAWQVKVALRVAVYHLLIGDIGGVREAMRFVKWASTVDVPVVERDGRQLWGCEHLTTGPDAGGIAAVEWLDVTDLHLLDIPFTQRRYLHHIVSLELTGTTLVATGTSVDYDGLLADSEAPELRFMSGPSRHAVRVAGTWSESDGRGRGWRVEGELEAGLGRVLDDRDRGSICLAVGREGLVNVTPVRSDHRPVGVTRYPGAIATDGPDAVGLTAAENGGIGWAAVRSKGQVPTAEEPTKSFWRDEVLIPVLARVGALLPARDLVLVDTSDARPANADQCVIAEALAAEHPQIAQAWVHRGRPMRVPESAVAVERLSMRHHWLAARARWRFDDGTATLGVRYRPGAATVFALDGVPVSRVGLDDPSIVSEPAQAKDVRRRAKRWTTVLTASDYASQVVASAYARPRGAQVTGLARLDAALRVRAGGVEDVQRLRAELDLPLDRAIVLYAPAQRSSSREPVDPELDLEMWATALGDRAYLLVRAEPGERFQISTRLRFAVRDISDPDLYSDFLAASDLLVADYARVIGDAAALGLPITFFQPDFDAYVHRAHGLYVGLDGFGPRSSTTQDLIDQVAGWLDDRAGWSSLWEARVAAFAEAHCGPLDGDSTRRAVDAVLEAGR